MLLRGTFSHDWLSELETVVNSMNVTPIKKLGFLSPSEVYNQLDSLKVKYFKKLHHIPSFSEGSYKEQLENQENYKQTTDLRISDYVYIDFNEHLFDKSYDVSV